MEKKMSKGGAVKKAPMSAARAQSKPVKAAKGKPAAAKGEKSAPKR